MTTSIAWLHARSSKAVEISATARLALPSAVVQPTATYLHMDNVNQSWVAGCSHLDDLIPHWRIWFILHNIHHMVTCQVLKGSGDIGYSEASVTQRRGTTNSYIFTHGQCQPILSSKMQSSSWLHLDLKIKTSSSQHPLHGCMPGPQSQCRYWLQQG